MAAVFLFAAKRGVEGLRSRTGQNDHPPSKGVTSFAASTEWYRSMTPNAGVG